MEALGRRSHTVEIRVGLESEFRRLLFHECYQRRKSRLEIFLGTLQHDLERDVFLLPIRQVVAECFQHMLQPYSMKADVTACGRFRFSSKNACSLPKKNEFRQLLWPAAPRKSPKASQPSNASHTVPPSSLERMFRGWTE